MVNYREVVELRKFYKTGKSLVYLNHDGPITNGGDV